MIEDLWYRNSVFYSLDVATYMDADGDGVGDFEGLVQRLDYLEALGVDALWLQPFQPSPMKDDGYDVSDYYGVDPRYGSSGDFVEFMHQAGSRGIRVIIDLVANHTSRQHRWFQEARSDPDSRYRDWYVWSKKRPKDWKKGIVFPGVQDSTWSWDEAARAYYYHRFYEFQPDLNMDNPRVRQAVQRVMGYWLQLGIAGFRMDAVPFVIENTVPGEAQGKEHFEYLAAFRDFLQWRKGDAILLGEANVLPEESRDYFGGRSGDGLHLMFNFFVNQHLFYALATAEVAPLEKALRATRGVPDSAQWANFLRNHDELDLGRLSDEQRQRVYDRFAPEPEMRLYERGIRRRLAPMVGDTAQMRLAKSLLFSLPGTPVLRYGEEIGMGDDLSLPERYPVRTPMQWSGEKNAGFSTSDTPIRPVVTGGAWGYERVNVEAQRRDPESLLNWTAGMIRLRKQCPEIGWGSWTLLRTGCSQVLAMRYDWRGRSLVVVHNFDERPHELRLRVGVEGGDRLASLLTPEESRADAKGVHRLVMDAYGYQWMRVGGLNTGRIAPGNGSG